MKEFAIKDIEMDDDGDKPSIAELLTGENIKGLSDNSKIATNAELETDEYVQFPDGAVQKVIGKTHEKGGEKMSIPDGTKVISNNLQLTKEQVKKLSKDFELDNISTKDTYADAIDKYTKKIGLKKLNDEQEEVITALQKNREKEGGDVNTKKVNEDFLAKKIFNIEQSKIPKEKERSNFFNVVFDMQEDSKPKQPDSPDNKMEYGGLSKAGFEAVCKKMGMTFEQGMEMRNGGIRSYADGGEEPFSGTFKVSTGRHSYSNEEQYKRQVQTRNSIGYGNINNEADINAVLQQLYENFPDIITDQEVFGKNIKIENGKVVFDKGISFDKKLEQVKNFQQRANDRMNSSADAIISNPTAFGQQAVDDAKKFKETQTFDQSTARAFDEKLGNFTSGRYNLGLDVLKPEEKTQLGAKGIYTINQLRDADPTKLGLSTETLSRVNKVLEIQKANPQSDFRLDTYGTPVDTKTGADGKPISTPADQAPQGKATNPDGTPIVDNVFIPKNTEQPQLFFAPDQSTLFPSALEANLKNNISLERLDPVRIGIEANIQEINDQQKFVSSQLEQIPDSQRASAMANLLATGQDSANKVITQTNVINAQNQTQTDLFNIGQSTQESIYNANNALDFENRTFRAKSLTEEQLRRYYDHNSNVNINNWENNQRLNLFDSLYPQYGIDPTGSRIKYTPDGSPILNEGLSPQVVQYMLANPTPIKT